MSVNLKSYKIVSILFFCTIITATYDSSTFATSNTDNVDQVNITVPVSCSLSGTGMNSHSAEISNGNYNSSIGETTMKVYCNDTGGYAIYAIGYTNNTEGKNVLTSSALGSTYDIATGTAISGNSQWAMKLSAVTVPTPTYPLTIENSFDSFHTIPDNYTLVAKRATGTDVGTAAEGSTFKTTYQAYVDATQPAGTYVGKVKYTIVHPNDGPAPEIEPVSIDTATSLQDATICGENLVTSQSYTLIDSRDNEQYKVAKLADGNCWILDNLRLDPTDSTVAANLSPSNTNASATAITNYLNGGSTTEGWASTPVVNETNYFYSYTEPMISNTYKNSIVTSFGESSGKIGIYYNYCAATVGTICHEEELDYIEEYEVTPYDICPAHWHMPTDGQYETLVELYASEESLQQAIGVSLSGSYSYDHVQSANRQYAVNEWGYYWSSSFYQGGTAVILPADAHYSDYPGAHLMDAGNPIRCVLDS